MYKLSLVLCSLILFGCNHPQSIKAKRLADTLATLNKEYDFRPLNQIDAYAFINNYYLPRLDSLKTKRKIFIHPINGFDFNALFNNAKIQLEKEYAEDSTYKPLKAALIPPSIIVNKKFSWDSKRLLNTAVIKDDTLLNVGYSENMGSISAWHHKYGYGYMCISYPQYNAYTKRLVIREWLENDFFCGTGRETKFWFSKVPGGWKAY